MPVVDRRKGVVRFSRKEVSSPSSSSHERDASDPSPDDIGRGRAFSRLFVGSYYECHASTDNASSIMTTSMMSLEGGTNRHRRREAVASANGGISSACCTPSRPTKASFRDPARQTAATAKAAAHASASRIILEVGSVIAFLLLAPTLLVSKGEWHAGDPAEAADGGAADNEKQPQQPMLRSRSGVGTSDNNSNNQDLMDQFDDITRSILLLGLVKDLRELVVGNTLESGGGIVKSMEQACRLYAQPGGGAGIWITYANDDNGRIKVDGIRQRLEHSGCTEVVLEKEEGPPQPAPVISSGANEDEDDNTAVVLSRYERLAMLRSEQRRRVLQRYGRSSSNIAADPKSDSRGYKYDVVVNIDFDLLALPKMEEFAAAVEAVASSSNSTSAEADHDPSSSRIVCANGYETWFNPKSGPRLYYDTLPAIDEGGRWYYQMYSRSWFQVVTFGQRRLFMAIESFSGGGGEDHSHKGSDEDEDADDNADSYTLWPMKSCFGGLAFYGWESFSSSQCDYVRSRIALPLAVEQSPNSEDLDGETTTTTTKWQFPQRYTLSGTPDGDACEHAVFQLCLGEEYRQGRNAKGETSNDNDLVIGIQPGLIASREANIMSTDEAVWGLIKGVALFLGLFGAVKIGLRRSKRKNILHEE